MKTIRRTILRDSEINTLIGHDAIVTRSELLTTVIVIDKVSRKTLAQIGNKLGCLSERQGFQIYICDGVNNSLIFELYWEDKK